VRFNMDDEITRETLVTHQGEIVQSRVRELMGLAALAGSAAGRSS
jgi:hypothetical protein